MVDVTAGWQLRLNELVQGQWVFEFLTYLDAFEKKTESIRFLPEFNSIRAKAADALNVGNKDARLVDLLAVFKDGLIQMLCPTWCEFSTLCRLLRMKSLQNSSASSSSSSSSAAKVWHPPSLFNLRLSSGFSGS